jgi:hypothetical protein
MCPETGERPARQRVVRRLNPTLEQRRSVEEPDDLLIAAKGESERCHFACDDALVPGKLGEARSLGWCELSRELG